VKTVEFCEATDGLIGIFGAVCWLPFALLYLLIPCLLRSPWRRRFQPGRLRPEGQRRRASPLPPSSLFHLSPPLSLTESTRAPRFPPDRVGDPRGARRERVQDGEEAAGV
jgi:hypothetical protein